MLFSPFSVPAYPEAPTLVILQLRAPVARVPVCLDLQAQWPRQAPSGLVSMSMSMCSGRD